MPAASKRIKYAWVPFDKQRRALECPAFELGYGGAPGGGKSDFLLVDPLSQIQKKGFKALLLRRKLKDLERSLIDRSRVLYRGRGVYNGQNHRWNFPNECSIEFGHCKNPADVHNYDSAQYHYIGFEQLEQFLEPMYTYFFTRIRKVDPDIKCKVRSNFNPGGIGHTWIKKRFWIHERQPSLIYYIEDKLKFPDGKEESFKYGRAFVPATVYDNDLIMKNDREYLMRLMALPEPQRTAFLEGRFDLFEGQFFKEWQPELHVCEPFEIPPHWRRFIVFDWGYDDPMVMLWIAEEPQTGIFYVYREYVTTGTLDTDVALRMDQFSEHESIYAVYYPWDLDNTNPQTGVSMHQRMDDITEHKYYWAEGVKAREGGWMAVRNLLGLRPDGHPRMKIFKNCSYLTRSIPEQVHDPVKTEDLDTFGDDHAVDALRYFAATYFAPKFKPEEKKGPPVIDLGGAIKRGDKYFFKKEEPASQSFAWMIE